MEMERNKIVFIGVLLCLAAFIVLYAMGMKGTDDGQMELQRTKVPELKDAPKQYTSKLEALDAIKEERESNKPSLYGESQIDSMGRYDPDLEIRERQRIVDSIYMRGRIDYGEGGYREPREIKNPNQQETHVSTEIDPPPEEKPIDLSKAHGSFFESDPVEEKMELSITVLAVVNGQQTVRAKSRLELRLGEDFVWKGKLFKRNSLVYGFVGFKANRVFVALDHIGQIPVSLRAFDLLDGGEGIYVENSFREEAQREVLDNMVQDINITGAPQLGGIKQLFRRSNRTVRVTVHDQYKLYLKP